MNWRSSSNTYSSGLIKPNDADKIIKDLQIFTEDALRELMRKIFKVARERQIKAFTLDDKDLRGV